jgi:membrane fusion protein, multidrug efflux system
VLPLLLVACGSNAQRAAGGGAAQGPPTVGYVVAQASAVPLVNEFTGRIAPFAQSEVRPQVSGVILRRAFAEGSVVRAGQTLYQIDPGLYQASASEAVANVNSARALADAARIRAGRLRPLAEMEAVSRQDYTDAAAQARQTSAAVLQSQAQLRTAQINLRFTRVPAPITGRIGRSTVTEGALVTANQADALAVIQRLDPVFVDIQQSSAELLSLRRALAGGGLMPAEAQMRLTLEDGSEYPITASVPFAETLVDPATGTVTLRARVANPQGLLLPGMFVRARITQAVDTRAILVPQQAVTRNPQGKATVLLVGADNKLVQRAITAARTQGAFWVVTEGLAAGDRIVTQGLGRLKPGAAVKPVPESAAQTIAPPRAPGS